MRRQPISVAEYVARVVALAPPLSEAQRRHIAAILAAEPRAARAAA
jgi:hypothetical protein